MEFEHKVRVLGYEKQFFVGPLDNWPIKLIIDNI